MDDIQASKKLTQILLDAGHRKIAGIFKEDDLQESEDSRDMQKHSSKQDCRLMTAISGGFIPTMKCGSRINTVLSILWMI